MIKPEQIPDEVVEAAAKVIAEANGWREKNSVSICKPVAAEVLAAALNAWEGAEVMTYWSRPERWVKLPLPKEGE
jgi:hypothetical protein